MHPLRLLSVAEQVAVYLRGELQRGRWTGKMPGVDWLADELGANRKTVEAALRLLDVEGVLEPQGVGRRRLIRLREGRAPASLRVAILLSEPADRKLDYIVELQHALVEAGHGAFYASKSMVELGTNAKRVAQMVQKTSADAWVVIGGAREVLEWFCAQRMRAFAVFGRREGLPIAAIGPDKPPALAAATRHLIGLGHSHIVLLARQMRRLPKPGRTERAFLHELQTHDLMQGEAGRFNLPDWEETIDGFHSCLHELFRVTPPTAVIVDEAPFFIAAQQFLARRRMLVPEQVSLICTDADSAFAWCQPSVAHIRWASGPVIRRIVRWTATVSRGGHEIRQTLTPDEFVPGGTIGPAPRG